MAQGAGEQARSHAAALAERTWRREPSPRLREGSLLQVRSRHSAEYRHPTHYLDRHRQHVCASCCHRQFNAVATDGSICVLCLTLLNKKHKTKSMLHGLKDPIGGDPIGGPGWTPQESPPPLGGGLDPPGAAGEPASSGGEVSP